MASYKRVDNLSKIDISRSLFPFVLLMISFMGVFWLDRIGVSAGNLYSNLFYFSIGVLTLSLFFVKDSRSVAKVPFSDKLYFSITLFLLGLFIPILLNGIAGVSTAQVLQPLAFGGEAGIGSQSFNAIQAENDPFWRFFVVVFTSGVGEEFALGFSIVFAGVLVGMLVRQLLGGLVRSPGFLSDASGQKWFDFLFAMLVSVGVFSFLHSLNASYVGFMFVIAGLFRLIMNLSIYVFNMFLSFTIGFHMANNAVWLGWSAVWQGLTYNWFGILIILFFILVFGFWVMNLDKLRGVFKNWKVGL